MMPSATPESEWHSLAWEKLAKVLGEEEAGRVMAETLERTGLPSIQCAADLVRFAEDLSTRSGFTAAVGAMLGLAATLRGNDDQ